MSIRNILTGRRRFAVSATLADEQATSARTDVVSLHDPNCAPPLARALLSKASRATKKGYWPDTGRGGHRSQRPRCDPADGRFGDSWIDQMGERRQPELADARARSLRRNLCEPFGGRPRGGVRLAQPLVQGPKGRRGAINSIFAEPRLLLALRYPCAIGAPFHAHPPLAGIAVNPTR